MGIGFSPDADRDVDSETSIEASASNIVEGCGAATNKEFARFLDISIKSANETEHHLLTARDLGLFSPDEWQTLTAETVEIRKMIYAYRKTVIESSRDST